MSQEHDTDDAPRKKKSGSVLSLMLLGLLGLGLTGFGVSSYSCGTITKIGSVGEIDISVDEYARALRAEMASAGQQFGITLNIEQLLAFGMDAQVRQRLIAGAAIENEAARIGLSVGDRRVAVEIGSMNVFQNANGTFDQTLYRDTLKRNNIKETAFETGLRNDLAQAIYQGAIAGNFGAPQTIVQRLYAYVAERRSVTYISLSKQDLPTALPAPSIDELRAFYDANIADFTTPEAKRISYAVLLPSEIGPTLPVDQASLAALYQENIADYIQPERRLVERLAFATAAEAEKAKADIDAGSDFDKLVAARGLTLDDVDMGDVALGDLGEAGDAVFSLDAPGVVGPFASDLGPALFRMNGILAAQETSFDDARDDLIDQYRQEEAARAIADQMQAIDDRLAEGASFPELKDEFAMRLGRLDYAAGLDDTLMGYASFRDEVEGLQLGDYPKAVMLEDGGILVAEFNEVIPATPITFDKTQDDVTARLMQELLTKALRDYGQTLVEKVKNGSNLSQFGITQTVTQQTRDAIPANAPREVLTKAFVLGEKGVALVEAGDYVGLVQLMSIDKVDLNGPDALASQQALAAQLEQSMVQDVFGLMTEDLSKSAGISLNNTAINAVHAQVQ